jgi:UDP-N-acetylglucosamine:LPS N-acetylglucosamine transferase
MKKLESLKVESNRFVVAFCGSGTGHLTQAMKAVEILEARGFTLAGVVTDTDAAEKMLDEMVRPLGVELLVIPAIELVDTETGFIPLNNPVRFVGSLIKSQEYLLKNAADIADFF